MTVTINDIGSYSYARLANIPTTINVGSIVQFITYGKIDVENYVGETISTTDVPTKYQNIMISIGCMYTLNYMLGANADFDTTMGEFQLSKADRTSPEFRELEFYRSHINESLKVIKYGGSIQFKKVYGVV